MFLPKDFVPDCFAAQICANSGAHAHFGAYLRDELTKRSRTKSFSTNIGTILNNMLTNFELKRLEPKLDIVEKPENRVHELTDSNGAHQWHQVLLHAVQAAGRGASQYPATLVD